MKFNDEKKLMSHHQNLQDIIQDQLSLASIHYLRSHYQEAIDIYKRILLDNRYARLDRRRKLALNSLFMSQSSWRIQNMFGLNPKNFLGARTRAQFHRAKYNKIVLTKIWLQAKIPFHVHLVFCYF